MNADAVPRGEVLRKLPTAVQRHFSLAGGDDYELVFTAAPQHAAQVQKAAALAGVAVTCIGRIDASAELKLTDGQGQALTTTFDSFDHFRA